MKSVVFSVHGNNISPQVRSAQAAVVEHFLPVNCEFRHHLIGNDHAAGINGFLSRFAYDLYIALDVDCIPLNREILPYMIAQAQEGRLVGCVQRANHIQNGCHVYAGPFAMAFSAELYDQIGRVSFDATIQGDVGESLTYECEKRGLPVSLFWPTHVVQERWDLVDGRRFGIATTYADSLFHCFEARLGRTGQLFLDKCTQVLKGECKSVLNLQSMKSPRPHRGQAAGGPAMSVYTPHFYESGTESCRKSAAVVVPNIVRLLHPASVIELGCQRGTWLAEFQRLGVKDVFGVDPWVPESLLQIAPERFMRHDFVQPLSLQRQFDLVVSLEFAEHLPHEAADAFVQSLTSLGNIVLFSAAPPGQGGPGHINEQPPEWWAEKFHARGFRPVHGYGALFANDPNVAWWYSRNMLFYVKEGAAFPSNFATDPVELSASSESATTQPSIPPNPKEQYKVRAESILPVVMTCPRNLPVFERFVGSYCRQVGQGLPRPVVCIDLTTSNRMPGSYLDLVNRLAPTAVHIHPRVAGMSDLDSINDHAFFVLSSGLAEILDREFLLFLEDDILLSSQIVAFLSQLELEPDTGLYTLYQQSNGYGSLMIEPARFVSTQCVLFPKEPVEIILQNQAEMEKRYTRHYDVRWGNFLGSRSYKLYASPRSYVQHIGVDSRLGCGYHWSKTFIE